LSGMARSEHPSILASVGPDATGELSSSIGENRPPSVKESDAADVVSRNVGMFDLFGDVRI
jgi:hypothetical protein